MSTRARAPKSTVVVTGASGQLGTCISLLMPAGVTTAVLAGEVKHTKFFGGVMPD